MKLKILKNEHYIDIVNECDFQDGSTAFTASCFLNKNIEGEFKDFSLTEENESIAKVLLCSFEMLELLKELVRVFETECTDSMQSDAIYYSKQLIKKATE
jgi:hypothetical protein